MPTHPRINQTLSIHEIWKWGKIVVLDDYSSWEVRLIDRLKTSNWSVNQKVAVIECGTSKHPYRIKNQITGQEINAKLITIGKP